MSIVFVRTCTFVIFSILTINTLQSYSGNILKEVEMEHSLVFLDNIMQKDEYEKTEHLKLRKDKKSEETAPHKSLHEKRKMFEEQLNDHFSHDETGHWAQPYYVDFTYQEPNSKSGPIFLEIGGEWTTHSFGAVFTDEIAKEYRAVKFSLQHRFYAPGAIPVGKTSSKYGLLSSQQALADAAYFIEKTIRQKYELTGPIIVSGCSYGGTLATWIRKKYPHYVNASVALSPPLLAKMNFSQYMNDAVAVAKQLIPECIEDFQHFESHIVDELSFADPDELIKKLGWCPLNVTRMKRSEAARDLVDRMLFRNSKAIAGVAQRERRLNRMKETVCPRMKIDPYSAVKLVMQDYFNGSNCKKETWNLKCMDTELVLNDTFNKEMCNSEYIRNTTGQDRFSTLMEAWNWQKCSEFGFFKTVSANTTAAEVMSPYNLGNFLEVCLSKYGLSSKNVRELVEQTNILYGGWDMNDVSKLLVVNGAYDPWRLLSLPPTEKVDFDGVSSIIIEGEHHCPNASEYVKPALKHWLA